MAPQAGVSWALRVSRGVRVSNKPHCFTIVVVGTLPPLTRANEADERAKIGELTRRMEQAFRDIYPDMAYGHPPLTITIVELPERS